MNGITPCRKTPCLRLWKPCLTALPCREHSNGKENSSRTLVGRSRAAGGQSSSVATRCILDLGSGPRSSLHDEKDLEGRKKKNFWSFAVVVLLGQNNNSLALSARDSRVAGAPT